MKRVAALIAIASMLAISLFSMSACKSGCGCHGDPFGDVVSADLDRC